VYKQVIPTHYEKQCFDSHCKTAAENNVTNSTESWVKDNSPEKVAGVSLTFQVDKALSHLDSFVNFIVHFKATEPSIRKGELEDKGGQVQGCAPVVTAT
jgi:hypothetical protein